MNLWFWAVLLAGGLRLGLPAGRIFTGDGWERTMEQFLKWSKFSRFGLGDRSIGYVAMADMVATHPEAYTETDRCKAANVLRSHGHGRLANLVMSSIRD